MSEKEREKEKDKEKETDEEQSLSQLQAPQKFTAIELEEIDVNIYRALPENLWLPFDGARGVFGGQLVGQSLAAALRTVEGKELHSMHSYFLRAGKRTESIVYSVLRLRDGDSFCTRTVTAHQRGHVIFTLTASFQKPEISRVDHQAIMPSVPSPELVPTERERWQQFVEDPRCPPMAREVMAKRKWVESPIDLRYVQTIDFFSPTPGYHPNSRYKYPIVSAEPRQLMWLRSKHRLPDDPNVHRSVLAYASDFGLMATARAGTPWSEVRMMASLDHSMWFHAPFRADEWLLYEMESPRARGARGVAYGRIFTADGVLAVTVAQEGMIRTEKAIPAPSKL